MRLTRRSFLAQMTAVPGLADVMSSKGGSPPHAVVVGAGAFGGWTALHLLRLGARVTLIDAWGAGNSRSSSGGESRVIRAIYGTDRQYVEMVARAFSFWEELEAATNERLYVETGALWMHRGDDAYVRSSRPILQEAGFRVEQLEVSEARARYPQIDLAGVRSIWVEPRAGVLFARRACMSVRRLFEESGGTYWEAAVVPPEPEGGKLDALRLEDGSRIAADAFVFACGPWLARLFPSLLGKVIRPTRQEVFFFGPPAGTTAYRAPRLPVWIDFGERIFYGIGDLEGRGFKIADDTRGEPFDPTSGDRLPRAEGLATARGLLAERFPALAKAPLIEARVCQYENSPDGHLIIDRHPQRGNLWLVGGGSGHGFKLAPAVGEITARAVLGRSDVPELFRLERLAGVEKSSTQFERK